MPSGHTVEFTSQQDDVVRKCWSHNSYGHHAAKRAAELTGLSRDVCQRRAVQLGLIFARERFRWTEPELQVVEANAHLSLETIQRKLMRGVSPPGVKRTRTAIMAQIHQQRFRTNLDGMKHGPLAEALGMSEFRLHGFRESKDLTGRRMQSLAEACGYRENVAEEHLHWLYTNDEIVRFIFKVRGELDLKKVNQTWLMGLLESYITILRENEGMPVPPGRRGRPKGSRAFTGTCHQGRVVTGPGILGDDVVQAIRDRSLRRRQLISTGALACTQKRTSGGIASTPNGEPNERPRNASGPEKSLTDSPLTGSASSLSADSLTDRPVFVGTI